MIAFILVCLESAHQGAAKAQVALAGNQASQNVLSHYEKKLYDQYGLLVLNDRFDLVEIMKESLKSYELEEGEGNHIQFSINAVTQSGSVYLMDQQAAGFQAEIEEIVTADVVNSWKNTVSSYLSQITDSFLMSETLSAVSSESDAILILTEDYEKLVSGVEEVKTAAKKLYSVLDRYRLYLRSVAVPDSTALRSYVEAIEEKDKKLKSLLEKQEKVCSEYLTKSKVLSKKMNNIRKNTDTSTMSEENQQILKEQLDTMEKLTKGSYYEQVQALSLTLTEAIAVFEDSYYPPIKQVDLLIGSEKKVDNFFKKGYSMLKTLEKLEITGDKSAVGKQEEYDAAGLLRRVAQIMKEGPYAYVVGNTEKVSKRTLVLDTLPSKNQGDSGSSEDSTSNESIFKKAAKATTKICTTNYYSSHYLDCYTDGGNYDLEYVIGGATSDSKNLKTVVNQLVTMRTALNSLYLLKDQSKYQMAQAAATAIAAVTVSPELIKAYTYLIVAAWAYVEAIEDVRLLLRGQKIPVIKTKDTWRTSLKGASDAIDSTQKKVKSGKGLDYKSYLGLLLFFHKRVQNLYRTLDMIQWNVCQLDEAFRIKQCLYGVTFDMEVTINPIFYTGLTSSEWQLEVFQYSHKEVLEYKGVTS